ncbi:uncharacterized protein L969DRAFT_103367 [Mixia osmundae IAM 14324]|uniref:Aprataxin C2HE/C2H2/C2HC zinc finger domain-containing protein n=1 Tax=Mixia osmundae (strain CBS 9802 / IAM 14324 / JCM 22182 / KY 12970) TaxID=764103 RepID=G7EA95_MIXOS|nr:uncharacterized protein L969DRAFT_103367 [Mixia osmundae IAM 14324]KEI39447.1 hypothetical protein L969DRAFT_103367 [Mixia osmundae IAM 14324]GAA99755.1 hypothetical protein E5Q_06458 [Mixia osmundae IAM 14324]
MSFDQLVLRKYAALDSPLDSLPFDVYLTHTNDALAIFDLFPKAKYHFLVLPRHNAAVYKTRGLIADDFQSLRTLLRRGAEAALVVCKLLRDASEEVIAMIQDEMIKATGTSWPISAGFHAVPSMHHIHLHVISTDLVSDRLKHKKHYNSFDPRGTFFLSVDSVIDLLSRGQVDELRSMMDEASTSGPLVSLHTGETFKNIPLLKAHLEHVYATQLSKTPRVQI